MTLQEFVFNCPLYSKVKISDTTILKDLCARVHIDGYNPLKDAESTYYLRYPIDSHYLSGEHVCEINFECQRYGDELTILIHFNTQADFIEKVGQYPSVADIHITQVKQYRKVLGEDYIHDFTKAIGLAANGVGTGSFIYLRRVFEHLVSDFADEAIAKGEFERDQFYSSKMDKKIKMLANYLPDVVLENKAIYGVLSAGIHELPEEECLKYFNVVRQVIELILDDLESNRIREEKKKKAKNELGRIAGEIKK